MFLASFKVSLAGVGQIFLLGAVGYLLLKKRILSSEGLNSLSRMVIDVTLPVMIFCQVLRHFSFQLYPHWWMFPLASIAITVFGLAAGYLFSGLVKNKQHKRQFISLIAFQNSGYLPLALIAALLAPEKVGAMFIYLFLFLAGFNLVMFSLGVRIIAFQRTKGFELASLFSPPVLATIVGLVSVYFGLGKFFPDALFKPLQLVGDCTLPLAMFVVGGNLAEIELKRIDIKEMCLVILAKLILLPALGLWLLLKFRLPQSIGLLLIMELAMPPATLLSVLTRHYQKEDLLVSQGILLGHLASIITIPLFLSLYFTLAVIQ